MARDSVRALFGSPQVRPTRWGLSSLRVFKPGTGLPVWLGQRRSDGRVPIYNYFNRVPAPRSEGYSVRVTHARDYLGGRHTYDGHLGTDFACPVGTPVVAPAPGVVVAVQTDMGYGGLKVCMDHGDGLFTAVNHLSLAAAFEGQKVSRGQVVGLSGASGLELFLFFPWVSPHVHFNVWLDGEAVDPFALPGELSLWRRRNEPVPADGQPVEGDDEVQPSRWSAAGVEAGIRACRDPWLRARMGAQPSLSRRAAELLLVRSYAASAFGSFDPVLEDRHPRTPRLDLPFRRQDFSGVLAPDGPLS